MRREAIIGVCVACAFAVIPATAQSFNPFWEVKSPPAAYALLAPGLVETVGSGGAMTVAGETSGVPFKTQCELGDAETITNPANGGEGEGEMTKFFMFCGGDGAAPYPCVSGEAFTLENIGAWPAELSFPSNETFEGVKVLLKCVTSGLTTGYHPPGHVWNPKLAVNVLKTSAASGIFKHAGISHFEIIGNDNLIPSAHGFVR